MLSRRGFLNSTLGTGVALAAGPAQAQAPQAGQPRRMRRCPGPPLESGHAGPAVAARRRAATSGAVRLRAALTMMDAGGVDRVHRDRASCWDGEPQRLCGRGGGEVSGSVWHHGPPALKEAGAAAQIPNWKQQRNMFGIRLALNANPTWLTDGTLDWFFPAAEKAGLPIMFLGGGMPNWARIAERHPQLPLIIDHMGLSLDIAKANKRQEAITRWSHSPNIRTFRSSSPTRPVLVRAVPVPGHDALHQAML